MVDTQAILPLLLSQRNAAKRIGISKDTFRKALPRLRALGLKVVELPASGKKKHIKFLTSSIDAAIIRAAERELDLNT